MPNKDWGLTDQQRRRVAINRREKPYSVVCTIDGDRVAVGKTGLQVGVRRGKGDLYPVLSLIAASRIDGWMSPPLPAMRVTVQATSETRARVTLRILAEDA